MRKLTLPVAVALMLLASACTTFYQSVVSLTKIVEGAARAYSNLYLDGLIPPDVAAKVSTAHLHFRQEALVAKQALEAYKLSGDPSTYTQAIEAARASALGFVTLILPYLDVDRAVALQSAIKAANAP